LFSFKVTATHNNIFFKIVTVPLITVKVSRNEASLKLVIDDSNKKKLPEKFIIKATQTKRLISDKWVQQ